MCQKRPCLFPSYTLEVEVAQGNAKRVHQKILRKKECGSAWVEVRIGTQHFKTAEKPGLTPVWETTFPLSVIDPSTEKLEVRFFLGQLQIGLDAVFVLDSLKKNVSTPRSLAFPGGKIDLYLRAVDFGKEEEEGEEEEEEGEYDWMEFL